LLEAYKEMSVELPEAADLNARHEQALAWVDEASDHLATEGVPTEEHAPILEVGISSLEAFFLSRASAAKACCVCLACTHLVSCEVGVSWGHRLGSFGMCLGWSASACAGEIASRRWK